MAPRIEEDSAERTHPSPSSLPASGAPVVSAPPLVERLGLGSTAGLLGDLARPFAWLGAQMLFVLQPTLSLFGAGPAVAGWAQSLEHLDSPQEKDG